MKNEFKNEIVQDLKTLIAFKSIKAAPEKGMPFGKEIYGALEFFLKRARDFGFTAVNVDGYAGRVEWGESKTDDIGVLCHLDVVPCGEGWTSPPFSAEVRGGRLYGRGAVDNKGPALSVLYAVRALKDAGVKPKKKIVFILGCDEETGEMGCVKHYFKKYPYPVLGFTPDSEFPLINCEKGIYHPLVKLPFTQTKKVKLLSLSSGDRVNVVPDSARAEVEINGVKQTLTGAGVRTHGSTPEKGKNALWGLLAALNDLYASHGEVNPLQHLYNFVCRDTDGAGLKIKTSDEASGPLTLSIGTAKLQDGALVIEPDVRYPVTKKWEDIEAAMLKTLRGAYGEKVEVLERIVNLPHHVKADDPLVTELLKAYEKVTGLKGYSYAIGGGTYAKEFPRCVAFGPIFPDAENPVHQINEYIGVEHLYQISDIYAEGLRNLLAI